MTLNMTAIIIIIIIGWIGFRCYSYYKYKSFNKLREIVISCLFIYLIALFIVVFYPLHVSFYDWKFSYNLVPLKETIAMWHGATLKTSLLNIGGNLILLAPIGFFIPLLNKHLTSFMKVTFMGFLISLYIETLQLVLMIRLFDVDDLIFNTISVIIGYLVFIILIKFNSFKKFYLKLNQDHPPKSYKVLFLGFLCLFVLLASFWTTSYFKASLSLNIVSKNSVYQTIPTNIVLENNEKGYYNFLVGDQKQLQFIGYKKTPFNRVVNYAFGDPLMINEFHNGYAMTGVSYNSQEMYYGVYGYNTSATKLELDNTTSKQSQDLEQGYFFKTFIVDPKNEIKIKFYNNDLDVTNKFN